MTARTDAFALMFKARFLSGLLFTATAVGTAWLYQLFGMRALAFVLLGAMMFLLSPVGTLLSAWTLWAGVWVSSCPNCMDFVVRPFSPYYFECTECGEDRAVIKPLASDLAMRDHSEDPPAEVCRDCC